MKCGNSPLFAENVVSFVAEDCFCTCVDRFYPTSLSVPLLSIDGVKHAHFLFKKVQRKDLHTRSVDDIR